MRPRHAARQAERIRRNAEMFGLTVVEWQALTRMERRQMLAAAKKENRDA